MTDTEPDSTSSQRSPHPLLRLVGSTVAKTLIVLVTLWAVFVVWALVFFLPHRQAEADWMACSKGPIEEMRYSLRHGDLKTADEAEKRAKACGEPPT